MKIISGLGNWVGIIRKAKHKFPSFGLNPKNWLRTFCRALRSVLTKTISSNPTAKPRIPTIPIENRFSCRFSGYLSTKYSPRNSRKRKIHTPWSRFVKSKFNSPRAPTQFWKDWEVKARQILDVSYFLSGTDGTGKMKLWSLTKAEYNKKFIEWMHEMHEVEIPMESKGGLGRNHSRRNWSSSLRK